MANLKKENDAIKAKETGQGGLTQGQQTQMARNEQRLEQVGFLSGPGEWCLIMPAAEVCLLINQLCRFHHRGSFLFRG